MRFEMVSYATGASFGFADFVSATLDRKRPFITAKTKSTHHVLNFSLRSVGFWQERGDEQKLRFASLYINPERKIPEDASRINGIRDEHVEKAPTRRRLLMWLTSLSPT